MNRILIDLLAECLRALNTVPRFEYDGVLFTDTYILAAALNRMIETADTEPIGESEDSEPTWIGESKQP